MSKQCNAALIYTMRDSDEEDLVAECELPDHSRVRPHESHIAGELITWTDSLG